MKFLIDAHLPRRLALCLITAGYDALHTIYLPDANRTTDKQILVVAAREQRTVVTKDADFVSSYLLSGRPEKLLLISTGNITNADLEALMLSSLAAIVANFAAANFIELSRTALIIHS